ncbi:hypothetical protein [Amycolatopsis antarctica]|uniref:hypothetical protein n=1 Tax=Amycolatopsis antarctica TaxID=1854586 RepID=UPI0013FDD7C1|nr:hypothetical protein [Amycolatopsis antarctica]
MTTETRRPRRSLRLTALDGVEHLVGQAEHDLGIARRAGRFRARCGTVFLVAPMCAGGLRSCPGCAATGRRAPRTRPTQAFGRHCARPPARPFARLFSRRAARHVHPAGPPPEPAITTAPPRYVDVPRPGVGG